jgi:hypothetical protein
MTMSITGRMPVSRTRSRSMPVGALRSPRTGTLREHALDRLTVGVSRVQDPILTPASRRVVIGHDPTAFSPERFRLLPLRAR